MEQDNKQISPDVRARAVRMVLDHQGEYSSRWVAVSSIAAKIGCTAQPFKECVKKAEVDVAEAGIEPSVGSVGDS